MMQYATDPETSARFIQVPTFDCYETHMDLKALISSTSSQIKESISGGWLKRPNFQMIPTESDQIKKRQRIDQN